MQTILMMTDTLDTYDAFSSYFGIELPVTRTMSQTELVLVSRNVNKTGKDARILPGSLRMLRLRKLKSKYFVSKWFGWQKSVKKDWKIRATPSGGHMVKIEASRKFALRNAVDPIFRELRVNESYKFVVGFTATTQFGEFYQGQSKTLTLKLTEPSKSTAMRLIPTFILFTLIIY